MPARIDSITGDEVLYVVDRTRDGGAQIAVQTDERKAIYFDLAPDQVLAFVRDLCRDLGATGCEHPGCYSEMGWDGCTFVDQDLERHNDGGD